MTSLCNIMIKKGLLICCTGLFFMTFITLLESNFNYSSSNIALDEFEVNLVIGVFKIRANLLKTTLILLYVKFTDCIGRGEVYLFYMLYYLLVKLFVGVVTSFSSFDTAWFLINNGHISASISEAVLLADLTSLANRTIFDLIYVIPYVFNNWLGTLLATPISVNLGWRSGYSIPDIILILRISLFFPKILSL
ncbi:hypothetical protein K502DRAFT_346510 [Neoconidiobolus thromboides FSU 785]|nr:hypothetical protein K502DRAFT_346510 [Neoconidiobolus thromboides FSU 785]